jgi:hypothetical protein
MGLVILRLRVGLGVYSVDGGRGVSKSKLSDALLQFPRIIDFAVPGQVSGRIVRVDCH